MLQGLGCPSVYQRAELDQSAASEPFGIRSDPFTQVGVTLPKSLLGDAIGYTLDQMTALTRYLDDGAFDIDNNAPERALRGIAVGRKNW